MHFMPKTKQKKIGFSVVLHNFKNVHQSMMNIKTSTKWLIFVFLDKNQQSICIRQQSLHMEFAFAFAQCIS